MDPRHAWLDAVAREHRLRYAFKGDRESWLALSKQVRRNVAQLEEHNAKPVGKSWLAIAPPNGTEVPLFNAVDIHSLIGIAERLLRGL